MNYLISYIICLACSVLALLNGSDGVNILFLSDLNVGAFLWIAYLIGEQIKKWKEKN